MCKESLLNLMKDGLEFVRNLAVTAALIKLGGTIYFDPLLVGSTQTGQLVGKFLIAVGVMYGAVSTGYVAWRHWPKTKIAQSFALVFLLAAVVLVEGTFTVAAKVVDADHARHAASVPSSNVDATVARPSR